MFFIILFATIVVLILTLIYLNGVHNENFWKKRGVTFHEKNKVMGPFWDYLTTDRALFECLSDIYKAHENEPAVAFGSFVIPTLFVIDPQNVQHVLQTDFASFYHRGIDVHHDDKLADNVLFMNGPRWKLMRQKMTPLFTSTKLKKMYYLIDKSAQDFVEYLKNNPQKLKGNGYDTANEFCCAAIAAAVFGVGTGSTFKSPFLKIARDAVVLNWKTNLKFAIISSSGALGKFLGLKFFKDQEEFFIGAIKQVLRTREKENVKKHDFADICLELQKAGTMKDSETGLELEPTDELLAAQGFFFLSAGVEPAASGLFGCLTELGKDENANILKKLQEEVDETFEQCGGNLTYEVISNMEYLDKVLSEALRMHTPTGFLTRKCVKDTFLPVGNVHVPKDTRVYVSVYDSHFNPKYFPNPEVFDPERFSKDKEKKSDIVYMPFGKGNRLCIGMRYARLQLMAGLVHLLRHYDVKSYFTKNNRKYAKTQFQLRRIDYDIEFIPRPVK